ncbi:MAG: CotH kinase family protein [Cyclobacteriaceae bacterium]
MKRILLIYILFLPLFGNSQLVINELMSNNVSFVMDDAYNFSMWVEVYNTAESGSLDLSDYYFTDDKVEPNKWRPKAQSISAQGFSILYFERDEREGHASFKLDPEGGELYLYSQSAELVDEVLYPAQFRNISYGRLSDGGYEWVFFEEPSASETNAGQLSAEERCADPEFSLKGGFYSGSQSLTFQNIPGGEVIYYTIDNSEPTKTSQVYQSGSSISIDATVVVRAKAYGDSKLSSNVISTTYFIDERKSDLRVVSISTDQRFLTDDIIGIYCDGTNGITGNLQKTPKNFNQDWDRPTNFEFFDEHGEPQLNQELDIRIVGGGSRESALKSISISPKKKFGENRLRYDFFAATKPEHKYKDIMMRNSGNDFKRTMMKDAFIQSLIVERMEVDYQAYEPAVIYINGVYCGIENIRERANKDFAYSNFGYDKDEVHLIEATYKGVDSYNDMPTDPDFIELSNFLKQNTMADESNYEQAKEMIDVEEFVNYLILEIFTANVDWPYNNVKMWKPTVNGKWRWILMDVEYSFSMGRVDHNTVTFALGENTKSMIGGYSSAPEWSVVVFSELIKNEDFKNMFIDRFAIHLSTTFEPERIIHFVDSMSARIRDEIPYHLARYNIADNFDNDLQVLRNFSKERPANVFRHISERFLNGATSKTISLSSDTPGATYQLNGQPVIDTEASISYFRERDVEIKANDIAGYKFKHWLVSGEVYSEAVYAGVLTDNIELTAVYEPGADPKADVLVFINEVVSSNQEILDEFGETDDYIELYNAGTEDIDIAGWYVTDNLSNQTKHQISSNGTSETVIPAGEWLVLWADDDDEQGVLHLNFKLSKEGEPVGIYRMNGAELETIDEVEVPELSANMSYSRASDGGSEWKVQRPTWNKSNLDTSPLSVADMRQVEIWPTLVDDSFEVVNAAGAQVSILDMKGKTHRSLSSQTDNESIEISDLPQGLYLVLIDQQVFKVIKR